MPKRILIDATHEEETRVVVLENGRVSEFDSETSIKKQLKGNIYLAKITRVEASLQSAFVEYGGDRHGFLPFSEIHPDYYDMPVSDKQQLLQSIRGQITKDEDDDLEDEKTTDANNNTSDVVEIISEDDEKEVAKTQNLYRKYKIQEVIKRNQILLVQVEKEERGNKGASLTTFISLAGRYCVLMPNSLRKGGVSRRIENREDRKRLKNIIKELKIPEEKGLIIRTAGAKKQTKDITADYNYLADLWNNVRQATLDSTAPAFIHAESDIIKRTIRDLHNETIDEVLIEGNEAYTTAKQFSKTIMSENATRIKRYNNKVPIFSRYKVEEQIISLYKPEVPLESGGALVISPTEALISIDVNSGKSTGHRSVEETALKTNIEAAREIALQLKLRDLSGLIVIDFIDMLELRNKKTVERVLKEALQDDKAKIQIGRISSFGLMEMSRQRLAASFLEINTMTCPHCCGTGFVKATESTSVTILRAIENEVSKHHPCNQITVTVSNTVALYILNNKRNILSQIEKKYNTNITIDVDANIESDCFYIEKNKTTQTTSHSKSAIEEQSPPPPENNEPPNNQKRNNNNNKNHTNKPNTAKAANSNVSISSILEGLWQKIVD